MYKISFKFRIENDTHAIYHKNKSQTSIKYIKACPEMDKFLKLYKYFFEVFDFNYLTSFDFRSKK